MSKEFKIYSLQENRALVFRHIFYPKAQEDYESSLEWYLDKSVDASENFIKAVKSGISSILKDPARYRNRYRNYHEYKIHKYPFTLVYIIERELQLIVIVSVHHNKKIGGKYRRP